MVGYEAGHSGTSIRKSRNNPMNNKFFPKAYWRLPRIALAMTLFGIIAPPVVAQKKTKRPTYVVPAGTVMRLRLNQALSSKSARIGDAFTSTVVDPVYARGVEVIPASSTVSGKITQVTTAARKGRAGSLNVTFTLISTPKPNHYAIDGSLAGADSEGTVKGESARKRNASFVGRGVVVGGLLNGAAGVATGATVGVARSLIKKGNEADIKPGTEFNMILDRSVATVAFR